MSNPEKLTDADIDWMRNLNSRGFAVSIFTPDELNGEDRYAVECAMFEGGWSWIGYNTTDEENADE